uniref:Fibronectin type-III domain-containing protein n=1 Tax=Amphimedon queenslandica TaxID=400682 RepID=A0A1X7VFS3_AMPQE
MEPIVAAKLVLGVGSSLVGLVRLLNKLYSTIEQMRRDSRAAEELCQAIECVMSLLNKYKNHPDAGFAKKMERIVVESYSKLEWYTALCMMIFKQGRIKKFIKAFNNKNSKVLKELYDNLKEVYQEINTYATLAISTQRIKFSDDQKIIFQNPGIYSAQSECQLQLPSKVDTPDVSIEGPQIHVKVNDSRNNGDELIEYHISINKQCILLLTEGNVAIIEPARVNPPLKPGESYSFQVRARNAKGLGEWSESTDICLDTGVLGKPDKPVIVSETGTDVVKVGVNIPKTYVNHVTHVLCQYHDKENGGNWISESFQIPENPDAYVHEFTLTECSPYAHHRLRVVFINKFGEGEPSETIDVAPAVSGAPAEVRYTYDDESNTIELSWEPPKQGPQFVHQYLIRYKKENATAEDTFLIIKEDKNKIFSKVPELKSNTPYIFFVSALNECGLSGPVSILKVITSTQGFKKAFVMSTLQ